MTEWRLIRSQGCTTSTTSIQFQNTLIRKPCTTDQLFSGPFPPQDPGSDYSGFGPRGPCLCFSERQSFTTFYGRAVFPSLNGARFVYPFVLRWAVGLFPLLALVGDAAVNVGVQVSA